MAMPAHLALAFLLLGAALPAGARAPALPGSGELLHFLGTEPFWGGQVRGGRMRLDWPENQQGASVRVARRPVGRSIVYTGRLVERPHFLPAGRFTMTVVRKSCSDGMSDRTYPYDVTIAVGTSRWLGCGWTARRPYREDPGA